MPYKDPEKRRQYQQEWQRARRLGSKTPPGQADLPAPFRLRVAEDLVSLLEEQIEAVREDQEAGTLARARCMGYLVTVGLRVLEQGDLAARIERLELVLKGRELGTAG
jgi:hypothetical protein